ncbi:hypothetical protein QBC36DRAFT_350340 [Triangularia setosa]|uniref:Nephrocystin 3-like N-terminal domain-containing protein n=1 Tax=Triangularia setosa TaxID=2587417 RepID=A0AAN6VZ89_9PEZI|nr:hypothetical protein QBC36DRAFT_350340 [Podospora setosa]
MPALPTAPPLRPSLGCPEPCVFWNLREEVKKDEICLADLRSTDWCLDKKRIEEAKGGLVTNAYRWILDNLDFNRWRNLPESRLFWVKGDPGKGKTMLLCGIINELEENIITGRRCCYLAYFFCQATDPCINNVTAILRGLIYLLARQQPRLLSDLQEYSDASKSLSEDAVTWVAPSKILRGMLEDPNLKVTYLLLDFIARISSGHVKWLLSSRNEVIEEKLKPDVERTRLSLELRANAMQVSHLSQWCIDARFRCHRRRCDPRAACGDP